GFLDAEAALRFDAQEGFRVQDVRARLVQAEAAPPQLPFAIRGLSGDLRFESGAPAAAVLSAAGEMGGGLLVARADARLDPATLRLVDWSAHVEIDSLRLDPRQIGSWDPALRDVLASLQPRGPLRVALSVPAARSWAVDPRDLEIEVVAGGMDFAYSAFPYPLTDARFTARVRGGELSVDRGASVRCGEGTIALAEGHRFLVELRRGGKVEIDLEASDLALDDRLRGALPLLGRSIWDDLQPGGRASAAITVRREGVEAAGAGALEAGVAPLAVRVDARVADARIQYRLFPYEVSAITGGVVYSSLEGKVRMQNLEGSHGEHRIRGEGEIDLRTEPRVRLDLSSDDLAIDEDMLAALPDVARRLLLDFRFEGRVKLERVGIDTADLETPVQVLLADVQGSVNHHGFPYPLRIGGGRFEYRGLKEIRLRDWRTPEESRPGIAFGVDVNAARQPCNIVYRARIAALDVDDRFRDALPIPLRELVSDLGLRGEYSGDLEVEHSLFESDLASSRIIYRAKNVESENAAVSFGIDVAEIRCSGNFEGSCGSGVAAIHSGDILVKSGRFNRLRLKDGRINFVFGEPHPLLGGERRGKYLPPVTFRLPAEYGAILDDKSARSAFQMAVTTDDFYGGQTSGFLFVKAGEGAEFGGHFISRDIDVQQASRDVFAVESENISGRASGQVSFRGPRGDSRGIRGDGEGKIVDGRLAELPIFFNILRLVNLNFDTASATRFNEIALPFRIEAGEFHSSAIEIKSSVMTLSGKGTMDFDGRLDLVLQPSFFPVEIPGLDEILGILKRVLSEIRVTGDLGDPKVDFKTAGGLLPIRLSSPRERETAPQEKR
ncbi:MAG: hypothetical protein JXA90_11305, partial [Planctomycetes bacterium]|nr:hypothetical protein [Planctomycetota bacterium]